MDTRGAKWLAVERGSRQDRRFDWEPEDEEWDGRPEPVSTGEDHFKRWEFPCGYSVPVFPLWERME